MCASHWSEGTMEAMLDGFLWYMVLSALIILKERSSIL